MDRCWMKNKVLFLGVLECITQFLIRNMSTALGHGSIAFGRTISSFLQGCFGIFNPILLNRNSKEKLRQLHSSMDRFWKNKSFFIPGCSGIFNPNTLTLFLMNCTVLQLQPGMDRCRKMNNFFISGCFGIFNPNTLNPNL